MGTSTLDVDSAFTRKRVVAGVASASLLAGFSLLAAAPATAATDADCTDTNTLTAPTDDATDIQALLDADTAIICLSGTFAVSSTLTFDHADLTIHGLADAVLDGGETTKILQSFLDSTLTIENLRFTGGNAGAGEGGAIDGYTVIVKNSQFDNNGAFLGGAISAQETADIDGSSFTTNNATLGGAVVAGDQATITNSTFTNNDAEAGGAVFTYGIVSANSSTFVTNSASNVGGAIYGDDGFQVINSTFVGNTAGDLGGAVFGLNGLVLQSTFLDNTAEDLGQAVGSYGPDTTLRGNIFAGSGAEAQVYNDGDSTLTDLGGNVFSTTQAAEEWLSGVQTSTQFSVTPALIFDGATLANNGGLTETVALYAGSPAVNGVPVGEPSVDVDQRGVARDALSDSGAYEFVGAVSPAAPTLPATGSAPAGWLGGIAAMFLAAGALALGLTRRARTR